MQRKINVVLKSAAIRPETPKPTIHQVGAASKNSLTVSPADGQDS